MRLWNKGANSIRVLDLAIRAMGHMVAGLRPGVMLLVMSTFSMPAGLGAQNAGGGSTVELRRMDDQHYLKTIEDLDYSERHPESKAKKMEPEPRPIKEKRTWWINELSLVWRILLFALLMLLIWAMVLKLGVRMKPARVNQIPVEELNPRDMKRQELEELLRLATERADHREVVRLNFLLLIRQLQLAGRIRWQARKTNREYALELQAFPPEMAQFRRLSLLFEQTIYGGALPDAVAIERWANELRAFDRELGRNISPEKPGLS